MLKPNYLFSHINVETYTNKQYFARDCNTVSPDITNKIHPSRNPNYAIPNCECAQTARRRIALRCLDSHNMRRHRVMLYNNNTQLQHFSGSVVRSCVFAHTQHIAQTLSKLVLQYLFNCRQSHDVHIKYVLAHGGAILQHTHRHTMSVALWDFH